MADGTYHITTRWCITGTLTLASPMHIGSGEIQLQDEESWNENFIQKTYDGKPYIPGSTLKGQIRALAEQFKGITNRKLPTDMNLIDRVFGREAKKEEEDNRAGLLEVLDAVVTEGGDVFSEQGVTINPKSGTVDGRKLFKREMVPADTVFNVVIWADNLETCEIDLVLQVLNLFDTQAHIGAHENIGLGQVEWGLVECKYFNSTDINSFITGNGNLLWHKSVSGTKYDPEKTSYEFDFDEVVTIPVSLTFSTPFLISEPVKPPIEGEPQLQPRMRKRKRGGLADVDEPVMPGSSAKGVIRSQAERIVNTISEGSGTEFLRYLFGDETRKSALSVSDFCPDEGFKLEDQEFVAIDRFTGGVAGSNKFTVKSVRNGVYNGTLCLNMKRLGEAFGEAAKGLLMLTLRDINDGLVTFGYGAAKGYGVCTAMTRDFELDVNAVQALCTVLETKSDAGSEDGNKEKSI